MTDRIQRIIGLCLLTGMLTIGIAVMVFGENSPSAQHASVTKAKKQYGVTKAVSKQKPTVKKRQSKRTTQQARIEPDTRFRKTTSTTNRVGPPSKRYSQR